MNELITVVIPVYERFNLLDKTINSVLNQTYKNLEILLIDDGSRISLAEEYIIRDERIKIITLDKNHGAQYARNVGIKAAKADWIAFIDSDDEWLPEKLSYQLYHLKLTKHLIAICDGYFKKNNNLLPLGLCRNFISGNITEQLLTKPSLMLQGILAAKKCFEKINYLDENVPAFHEWDTIIRLSKKFPIIIEQENLFIYNLHDEMSITKNIPLRKNGYKHIITKHLDRDSIAYGEHLKRINTLEDDPHLFNSIIGYGA